MDERELKTMLDDPNSSQRIMIYERDEAILGSGPKYTVAFRGSTNDPRDWNNNGRNEMGLEAPHQANAAALGKLMRRGARMQGKEIDELVSTTGHSKGGSEAQAFAAASGASARVFNPAGFDASQYSETNAATADTIRVDRTSIIDRAGSGAVLEARTDPLYYAQHEGMARFVMKKPLGEGTVRELGPVDPSLASLSQVQSDTEPHSMLQVVEALERDKSSDQAALTAYTAKP